MLRKEKRRFATRNLGPDGRPKKGRPAGQCAHVTAGAGSAAGLGAGAHFLPQKEDFCREAGREAQEEASVSMETDAPDIADVASFRAPFSLSACERGSSGLGAAEAPRAAAHTHEPREGGNRKSECAGVGMCREGGEGGVGEEGEERRGDRGGGGGGDLGENNCSDRSQQVARPWGNCLNPKSEIRNPKSETLNSIPNHHLLQDGRVV